MPESDYNPENIIIVRKLPQEGMPLDIPLDFVRDRAVGLVKRNGSYLVSRPRGIDSAKTDALQTGLVKLIEAGEKAEVDFSEIKITYR